MNKKILLDWVDELKFVSIFAQLDQWKVQDHLLEKLRKEFISGTKDADFCDRLKVFILNLKEESGQESLRLYILTANKTDIEEIAKQRKIKMPTLRYHETDLDQWQPFEKPEKIKDILSEYQRKKGFPLQYECIHSFNCEDAEIRDWVRENRKNMILWADLFAINEKNKSFAKYFDDGEIGGLLTSVCLSDNEKLREYSQSQLQRIFKNRQDDFENHTKENTNMALGIPSKEWLFRILTNIAILHFKISRQMNREDHKNIRNLSF